MLELTVLGRDNEVVVTVSGMLDTLAAQELDRQLDDFASRPQSLVAFDLSALSYLNSSGIKSLVHLDRKLRICGKQLVIRGASSAILRIFGHCGLDAYFTFEGTVPMNRSLDVAAIGPLVT